MTGLGFIGAGNMGEAMIRGVLSAKLYPADRVFVHDTAAGRTESLRHRFGVSVASSVEELLAACDTVVVAVKPQVLPAVLGAISKDAARGKTFISIVAGAKTAAVRAGPGGRREGRADDAQHPGAGGDGEHGGLLRRGRGSRRPGNASGRSFPPSARWPRCPGRSCSTS